MPATTYSGTELAINLLHKPRKAILAPKVRQSSFDDYPQIASLAARNGLKFKSYGEWQHLWIDNPLYKELQKQWPMGWVLENEDRHIVGYFGNIPLAYELGGSRLVAATGHAWVVDSIYRGYSLLLLAHFFAQE